MDHDPIQTGSFTINHQLKERDIHENQLAEKIGRKWKDLARALGFTEAVIDTIETEKGGNVKECCIAVLVRWIRREGRNATMGKLADALIKIELKSLADILMLKDTTQNDRFKKIISQMQTNCRHLEEEGSKMRLTVKELEEKLSIATQKYQGAEREGSEMRTKIKQLETSLQDSENECTTLRTKVSELEKDLAIQRQQQQDTTEKEQEGLDNSVDAATEVEDVSGASRNDLDTDQATRERGIKIRLKRLDEMLKRDVTSLLQVPEVREDKLKTAVKLDLLTKLSESLQNMYSEIQRMVAETCKCNEDLKTEFYDFAYHGLRAEHNDLVLRVEDLESSQAEMSEDERKAFKRLQQCQNNRRTQIDRLEKVWRGLFSSPESLPETSSSDPTVGSNNSKKAFSRKRTDPGARQKQTKPRQGATSSVAPPASDEEVELCFTKFKQRSTMSSSFRPKVSYRTHRDS